MAGRVALMNFRYLARSDGIIPSSPVDNLVLRLNHEL